MFPVKPFPAWAGARGAMTTTFDGGPGLSLEEVLDRLVEARDGGEMSVDDVLAAFGPRAFGPLLLVPALIAITPVIGALPGVSWGCSALVVLVSIQFLLSSRKMWLPGFIRRAHMPDRRFDAMMERVRPWFRRIGFLFRPRLQILLHPVVVWFVGLLCLALGLAMFVFSVVPGGIVIPAAAVLLLALALTTHDGLLLLFGLFITGAVVPMVFTRAFMGGLNAIF